MQILATSSALAQTRPSEIPATRPATRQATTQESNPRLHPNGQAWRFVKARTPDPQLPRVLLIGDSILNGYLEPVTRSLNGKAAVDAWVNPYWQSESLNKMLAEVIDQNGPYEVVHFNMGLHGWPEGRIKEGTFQPLTRAYVQILRQKLPRAKIIWASSTPVTAKDKPSELDPKINPVIVEHNRLAALVMSEEHVAVNDLFTLMLDKFELASGDGFHWKPAGYLVMSKAVTTSISAAIQDQQAREHK